MQNVSSIRKDFIATHLRAQIHQLSNVVSDIEGKGKGDCGYADESLKKIEQSLKQIRKVLCEQ